MHNKSGIDSIYTFVELGTSLTREWVQKFVVYVLEVMFVIGYFNFIRENVTFK